MDKSIGSAIHVVVLLMFFVSGCTPSTQQVIADITIIAAEVYATQTGAAATPFPIPPSSTPEPTSTSMVTPSPTPLPGLVVYPLDTLGKSIPWLPLDKNKAPVTVSVFFNTQITPFNNSLVRQAFVASIDRDSIVKMAKKWYAIDPSPATTFIPPQVLGRDLYGEVGINFDPTRARDLLSQAGYTDTSAFPKVTLIVNYYGDTSPGARENIAKAMAEMWLTHLGITVNIKTMKPPGFGDRLKSNPPGLFWNGWTGSDPILIDIFHSDSEMNFGHFSNPDLDSLIEQARSSHDPAERQILYIQAERLLCEVEAAVIPLYHAFLVLQ